MSLMIERTTVLEPVDFRWWLTYSNLGYGTSEYSIPVKCASNVAVPPSVATTDVRVRVKCGGVPKLAGVDDDMLVLELICHSDYLINQSIH